jgi:hypothetical protein
MYTALRKHVVVAVYFCHLYSLQEATELLPSQLWISESGNQLNQEVFSDFSVHPMQWYGV